MRRIVITITLVWWRCQNHLKKTVKQISNCDNINGEDEDIDNINMEDISPPPCKVAKSFSKKSLKSERRKREETQLW